MTETPKTKTRGNSLMAVGPYARIRIIVAVVIFVIAIVALGVRALSG